MAKKRVTTPKASSDTTIIPRLSVRREWPFFIEHRDAESIDAVIDAVDVLWDRTAGDVTIDNRWFFGATAKFTGPAFASDQGDARIAIANYRHLVKSWRELLAKPCWANEKTYPPATVLAALIDQQLVNADITALSNLRHDDHKGAIDWLEQSRLEAVAIIRPTMAMFFASLTVEGKWSLSKGKRRTRPTESRNEQLAKWRDEGHDDKTCMALWNEAHPKDLISLETVRQAIGRAKRKRDNL